MQRCVGALPVAMAAVMPLSESDAVLLVRECNARYPQEILDIGNINSPKQIVLSGSLDGVRSAVEVAKSMYRVKRAVMLNVSCPFHSRLMLGASRPLASYLRENVSVRRPTTRWSSNLSAKCVRPRLLG
eukprot:TRINITY_DN197_c0_g1_i7.p2 TRINITY_DN197_c0_g1~~TRINITY_DN197_c0_g1_i7.p2  ORF type:complete len:129 (-),score=0.82 TRINITY_DN197_c0_g1_i7:997-1383(-)